MSTDDPLLSSPMPSVPSDLGQLHGEVVVSANGVLDFLPALASLKDVLAFFYENPDTFLTIADALQNVVGQETCVGKWDLGLNPLGHTVAGYIDSTRDKSPTVSIMATMDEDALADAIVSRAMAVPRVRSLGVQGSTGLQINRGEVLKYARMFLEKALPLLLPLLLKR
jgi:hypothetical protein